MRSARVQGWLGPLAVTMLAGVLRFWRLGSPHVFVFDETYYAKDGWSLLRFGVERAFVKKADKRILRGDLDVFNGQPGYVLHPPAGKWVIAAGERIFGFDPYGWRFMVAVLGTLTVLILARTVRRMTGSTLLGSVAGLLLAVDGLHVVLTRTALLDGILTFWLVAGFAALVVDRDQVRRRLAAKVAESGTAVLQGWGPPLGGRFGLRPWRLLAGVCLGIACATKWSGVPVVAVFAVMTLLWDVSARRRAGVARPWRGALLRDAIAAFAAMVILPLVVYLTCWSGWFATKGGYDRQWADGRDTSWPFIPSAVRALWHYHVQVYQSAVGIETPHPYEANPWGWLVLSRPTSMFVEYPTRGEAGCTAVKCTREVIAIGTPALWWIAVLTLPVVVWMWLARRDWRAGAALAGIAATYLPWFRFQQRTIFDFYAVAIAPFLVIGLVLVLGAVLGPPHAGRSRRVIGSLAAGAFIVVVLANFTYFWPLLHGGTLPSVRWTQRIWLQSWI